MADPAKRASLMSPSLKQQDRVPLDFVLPCFALPGLENGDGAKRTFPINVSSKQQDRVLLDLVLPGFALLVPNDGDSAKRTFLISISLKQQDRLRAARFCAAWARSTGCECWQTAKRAFS